MNCYNGAQYAHTDLPCALWAVRRRIWKMKKWAQQQWAHDDNWHNNRWHRNIYIKFAFIFRSNSFTRCHCACASHCSQPYEWMNQITRTRTEFRSILTREMREKKGENGERKWRELNVGIKNDDEWIKVGASFDEKKDEADERKKMDKEMGNIHETNLSKLRSATRIATVHLPRSRLVRNLVSMHAHTHTHAAQRIKAQIKNEVKRAWAIEWQWAVCTYKRLAHTHGHELGHERMAQDAHCTNYELQNTMAL